MMEKWVVYALISMVFAGLTAVTAKIGLEGISGEVALAVRTCFVFALVLGFSLLFVSSTELKNLTRSHFLWLGISAATTAISWVFYYKALADGDVSTVALIDKGSFVVAITLAWLLLNEKITLQTGIGTALILAGVVVVARK